MYPYPVASLIIVIFRTYVKKKFDEKLAQTKIVIKFGYFGPKLCTI